MQRSARALGLALDVEGAGLLERVRVERDEGAELRAVVVVGLDAREVELGQLLGGQGAGG
jgi:hypothetical protein